MVKEKTKKIQKGIVYPKVKVKDVFGAMWNGVRPQKWLFFTLIGAIAIVFSGLTRTQTVERNLITIVEFDPIKKILVGRFDTPYYKQKNLA